MVCEYHIPILDNENTVTGIFHYRSIFFFAFNKFLCEEHIPQAAAAWLSAKVSTKLGFLLLVNIFLLLLGCVMDIISAILIVAPLLAPIAIHYGVDPIHFGIIFIVNLQIGYITPPIGINVFTVKSAVPDVPLTKIFKGVVPFVFADLVALLIIVLIPGIATLLPSLMRGGG